MKRRISFVMMLAVTVVSLAACGTKEVEESRESTPVESETVIIPDAGEDTVASENTVASEDTIAEANTIAEKVQAVFLENADKDLAEIADAIKNMDGLGVEVDSMEVSEGYLNGFSADVTGFQKGVVVMPFIGSIPFITYVFETEDPAALESALKDNADLRWNVCTEADQILTSVSGNKVFLVMAPWSFE